jgi:hypothetical protein
LNQSLFAERYLLHYFPVGKHRDHDVAALGDFSRALGSAADFGEPVERLAIDVVERDLVSGLRQMSRHRRTHDAQADEADFQIVISST